MNRRRLIAGAAALATTNVLPGAAQTTGVQAATKPIRIGYCTDLSGPYQDVVGPGGAKAIRMAIVDLGGSVAGRPIELLLGDHRNDVNEAASIARRWCGQEGVDVMIGDVNSDTSLALSGVAAECGKPVMIVGAGTSVQTRERPAPGIIQYAYDTVALATVPGLTLNRQGDKRWFYITADYPSGRELEAHGRAAVTEAGGLVVGSILNPHEADDFTPSVKPRSTAARRCSDWPTVTPNSQRRCQRCSVWGCATA